MLDIQSAFLLQTSLPDVKLVQQLPRQAEVVVPRVIG
jgi:hypothetical protein